MERFTKYLAILTALAMLSGCGRLSASNDTTNSTPTTGTNDSGTLRFADVFQQVLGPSCQRCHGPGGFAGVNVTSQGALVQSGVVVAGSSNQSQLVDAIESGRMPRGASRLSASQITLIRNWIDQGAKP